MWRGGRFQQQLALVALGVLAAWFSVMSASVAQAQSSDSFSVERRGGGAIQSRSSNQYCGSRLSEALKLLCRGEYNSYFKAKKASQPPDEYWAPFRERLRAAAFLESRNRFTRGVFDECCSKSCTVDELMTYCATQRTGM